MGVAIPTSSDDNDMIMMNERDNSPNRLSVSLSINNGCYHTLDYEEEEYGRDSHSHSRF